MFFDMHSDILYDIVQKKLMKKRNILKDNHLHQLEKGNILGGIWTYYTDIHHPLCDFNQAIDAIMEELEEARDMVHIVKEKDDFSTNKINVVLGFESLQPIKDVNHLKSLYDLGFRHAMLTWNEQNHYATGANGDPTRGLTELGKEIIHFMNQNNMIIDVSHANKQTFNDIINSSTRPVIASHSNVNRLCSHKRNLDDMQIRKLTEKGGVIGITAVKNFVNPYEPTINEMINHIDYLKKMNLIKHIGLGFDFMDYLNGSNLTDLPNASYTNRLIKALQDRNYTHSEIEDITHNNIINIINELF
ncbi:membrane dipeptidase [Mycoplasmatota bacterium]|nr:membrane dipeptidase [Mycoplasmatota bacterium]